MMHCFTIGSVGATLEETPCKGAERGKGGGKPFD